MIYLEDNTSTVSKLIENQFPYYVQENTPKFLKFLTSYYESQEGQYQPFDIASNLLDYYSISYYRPNRLTENTVLTGNLSNSSTTVSVKSTQGFPHKNGYIKIGNEIIFYRDKTATTFTNCVRGTKALVLDNIPKSHLTLTTTTAAEHLSSLNTTKVINLAYYFANEFVDRIKKEIAPFIPEVLDSELDLGGFLGKIKSFYLSKGSLNSHRTLFRILYNDRKFTIKLKGRGKNAVIKVDNIGGTANISTNPQNGGSEYDHRKAGGELINPPIVEVFGTGRGTVVNNIRPNATAKITVKDIRASDGAILTVSLDDAGEGYVGPITARVRPRRFKQDEIVINQTNTGTGKVEFYDAFKEELVLYDVVGYFAPEDDIYVANQGEQARAFIKRTDDGSGVTIQGEQQEIEFPREYTFKTSASDYIDRKIIRCKILGASGSALPAAFSLKQDADTLFGVKGVEIEADNQKTLSEDIFEIEVSTNTDLHDIYLQPSTLTTKAFNISSDTILTVDDASRFPLTNGIIRIGDNELNYTSRSVNQFFGCTGFGINVPARTEIISFGRKKYNVVWASNQVIKKDEYRYYGNNLYIAVTSGTTGSTAPTHTTGNKADGSIITTPPAVTWRFFSKNRFDHSFYIDNANKPRFQILGMPGDVLVTDGGALHTDTSYEFSRLDSPNADYYNFTTNELSDRLAVVLGSNVNRTREVVTNNTFPSYGSLYGFNNQYDYGDHVYVASSGIPRWWNDIGTNSKKIAFQDQKIVQRWKKTSLISDTQAVGPKEKTKKLIGLNIDGIQINSYKGSTVEYGAMNKFYISNGGTYPVPYDSTGLKVDLEKLPKFDVTGIDPDSGTSTTITLSNSTTNLVRLSSSIKSINFNNLVNQYLSDGVTANPFYGKLSGYQSKPIIEVINNNPQTKLNFTNFLPINEFTNEITFSIHSLSTGDKVTYTANDDYFEGITPGEDYYVRKVTGNTFTLHVTESNALLNAEILSMYSDKRLPGLTPQFSFETQIYNPAGYKPAVIDISYANGNIDNLIIVESGAGYVEVPTIRISGGGKTDHVDVPYQISDNRMIEMFGSLLSYDNFNKTNSNEIDVPTTVTQKFTKQPTIKISDGKDATATAYVANGELFNIVITNPGENYFIPPAITLSGGGGTGGVIRAETSATGQITRFIIVNKGTGYTTTPRIVITPLGVNGGVTVRLKEWTFNMVRRLKKDDRLDTYGGYVYDSGDVKPSTDNVRGFNHLTYKLDFPKDINEKQYYLMHGADRLTARYIYEKNVGNARSAVITSSVDSSSISVLNPTGTKDFKEWADANPSDYLTQLFALPVHTPVMGVSYDGIPFYSGKKVNTVRNKPDDGTGSGLTELKSQYKLNYETVTASTTGRIQVTADDGSTAYVLPKRDGGASLTEYPIGTFIEDYTFVASTPDKLDRHNGRFCVTPDFPEGRYCYFITTQSHDGITNQLITASSVASNGFPYFIGDTFAGECDGYMNVQARTNDRIPKSFTRANEKQINEIPKLVNGYKQFYGLPANNEYPQEDIRLNRSIAKTAETTQGTVDSVIIEAKGDGYQIGDRVIVDNTLTYGSDFSAFVSRIVGKDLRKKTDGSLEIQKSTDNLTVTFETNQPHGLAIGDYVYFDYEQPIDPNTGTLDLVEVILNNAGGVVSSQINKLDNVQVSIRTGEPIDSFANKEIYALNLNSKYKYNIKTPPIESVQIWYEIDQINEWFQVADSVGNNIVLDASKIPDTLYLTTGNYIYVINKVNDYKGSHIVTNINSGNNEFTIKFAGSTVDYSDTGLYYAAKSNSAIGPIDTISISSEGFGYRLLPEVTKIVKKGDPDTIAGDGKAVLQTNSNTIGSLRNIVYSSIGTGFTCNENVNYYLNLPATAKIINNFEISDITILDDPNGVNPTGGKEYDNVPKILVNNVVADGTDASIGNANIKATVAYGTITKIEVISGGAGFEKEPTITISSTNGSGALLKASIRRKRLISGNKLTGSINSQIFPIPIEATIVSFSEKTSTLVFNENAGQFNADSDKNVLYTSDGLIYGKITSIRRSKAYAKVNPYGRLEKTRKDIVGNPSENLQRVLDSHYYQDWSYSLTTSRDTKEWMDKQDVNTHPAGFKQFGRKLIAKRNNVFDNPADVFASSVIFKTTLSEELDLKVGLTKCYTQTAIFGGTGNFSVGDYVIGLTSKTIARILDVGEYFVKFMVRSGPGFQIGELVLTIPDAYAFTLPDSDATDKNLIFWEGIWQEPKHSYTIANDPNLTFPAVGAETFVPNFAVTNGDEILYYHPNVNKFDILDSQTLTTTGTTLSFTKGGNSYAISNLGKVMISIGGAVQNPANMSVSNNTVNLGASPSDDSRVFAVGHQNLNSLTFSGSAGTQFTMNYTPSSNCKLLIFFTSVFETHLVPASNYSVSGNVITFSESVNPSDIFGWYLDESTTCAIVNTATWNDNQIQGILGCTTKRFNQHIESNASKTPDALYELRARNISGTVYGTGTNSVRGFDTRFTYTSPSHSSSFVEVLEPITLDGSTKTFTLKRNGVNYSPTNGEESLVVYLDNEVLDHDKYAISGQQITFSDAYASTVKCTLIDYVSSYLSNTDDGRGAILDRLGQDQTGSRTQWNLADKGVPQYVANLTDIFVIKNNLLLEPNATNYSITGNLVTFVDSPTSTDNIKIPFFNRQLVPTSTNNVILDKFRCVNGTRVYFPLTSNGILIAPALEKHFFVIRNGVMQRPGTDYTVSASTKAITFTTAPSIGDIIFSYYSYDGVNQNIMLDDLTGFNGSTATFNLTHSSGTAFTPPDVDDLMVVRNGVVQNPTQDWTVSGSQITFTTAPANSEQLWILYTHGSQELTIASQSAVNSNSWKITMSTSPGSSAADYRRLLVHVDGAPRFFDRSDFTVSGNDIILDHTGSPAPTNVFVVKIPSVTQVDEIDDCPDGTRKRFKLFTGNSNLASPTALNLVPSEVVTDADILVSINGIVQDPGTDYSITTNKGFIDFVSAPTATDNIFMVKMSNNLHRSLSASGSNYTLSTGQSAASGERDNIVVFSNNTWKFAELGDFTWVNDTTITLSTAHTTGKLFAIKFTSIFKLLDQIDQTFTDTGKVFNLYDVSSGSGGKKIFTPTGTVDNDNVPDETSLLVVKNGKILDPKVDFILSGDNKTQITLTDDPATTDIISVRSVGSFDKLDTITNQSNITELTITKSSASYYPNAHIERPRNWENQYLVIKDGYPLSPLYDYYVTDNKMYFTSAQTFTKMVILDFRGTANDVKVLSRGYEVVIGDELQITGEVDPSTKEPLARTISGIVSPTVLTTQSFTGNNIFTWGSGNLGSTTISNGVISALTTTSGSVGFKNPVVLRTEGTGLGAKATATVSIPDGGEIVNSSIDIQYPGYNVYNTHKVFPTVYASTYKKQAVSKTEVRKGTKLTSNINNSVETIALKNTANMTSNTPTFTITGTHSGSNASFRPFISGGEVKKVEIISGGTGYDDRDINITLTGGGGTGCVLEPVLNSSGTVTSITVKNPGVGYDTFRIILRKEVSNVVNAEIVEYTTVTSSGIEGCTRAVLGTAQSYSANDLVYFDNYI